MTSLPVLINIATYCAALLYLAAFTNLLLKKNSVGAFACNVGLIAAALHLCSLLLTFIQHDGLSSSFFDAISLTSFIIVTLTIGSQKTRSIRSILLPVFLIAAIAVIISLHFGDFRPIKAASAGMLTHILSSITAYVTLCLAALQAILLAITERNLKRKTATLWSMPPLQSTESFLFRLIGSGWLILTLSIFSGLLFIDNIFAQHLVHKTTFSLISWLIFGTLLFGHSMRGWRGTKAASWTMAAFVFLALAYFGSKFVLDVILERA